MTKEEEIRKKVRALKRFYMDLITYGVVNAILVLVWLTFDRTGTFWPKYVLVVWGIALIFKAYRIGLISLFCHHISFLTPEWEEKKVKELMGPRRRAEQHKVHLNRDIKK